MNDLITHGRGSQQGFYIFFYSIVIVQFDVSDGPAGGYDLMRFALLSMAFRLRRPKELSPF